jgi:hypothetical protein
MKNPSSPLSEDEKLKREKNKEISLAPLTLLDEKFTENLKDDKVTLNAREVRENCFKVLRLIDQYHREPKDEGELLTIAREFDDSDLSSAEKYLEENEEDLQIEQNPENKEKEDVKDKHRTRIVEKIRKILESPQVREELQKALKKESGYYEKYKGTLERLKVLRRAELKATKETHQVYLGNKKQHKKLTASGEARIKGLSGLADKVEDEKQKIMANAHADNGPELGLITAQELLRYKRQIKEKGFALTESRQKMLNWIVENAMAGRKVFLVGSTGTGKTELMLCAFRELGNGEYEIASWHEGTTPRDLLGQMEIRKSEGDGIESGFKPGPLIRAYQKGIPLGHEELTGGTNRAMLGLKYVWNLKEGQRIQLAELNGTPVDVEKVIEIATGNPKDERTKDREELDPAILRMLKGLNVQYMPADEMTKVALATLMEDNGVLELSKEEVEFIKRLAEAASLMQQCHNSEIPADTEWELKRITGLDNFSLTKNFLDTGTFFSLFAKYDFEKARGRSFSEYISKQLAEFINDPKTLGTEEERKILMAILKLKGVVSERSDFNKVETEIPAAKKDYLLPSELGFINGGKELAEGDPFLTEEERLAEKQRKLAEMAKKFGGAPEHKELVKDMEEQYGKRRETLEYFEFINKKKNSIKGVDNKEYAMPTWEEIRSAITKEHLEKIKEHIQNPMLLVVPVGMRVKEMAGKIGSKKGALTKHEAVYTDNWDITADMPGKTAGQEEMVYFPEKYDKTAHKGHTKKEILDMTGGINRFPGWQVLVVDGGNTVPADTKKSANDLLAENKEKGLSGLTPEEWLFLHAEGVRRGDPYDKCGDKSACWHLGAFLKGKSAVPRGYWHDVSSGASLYYLVPSNRYGYLGARRAVRIM